jgi:hypothetical protein
MDVPAQDRPPGFLTRPRTPGTAGRPPRPGILAPGQVAPGERNTLDVESADAYQYLEVTGVESLVGNVRLRYNGYTVSADRASYDRRRRFVTFENNVVLTTARQIVLADYVRFDTRTEEFETRGGRTVIPPDMIGQQITQAVRLSGETISREGRLLIAVNGLLTTCDFPDPHFKIGFAKATVIPNQRIALRKAVLYRYDKPVLRLEYLSLPIHEEIRYSYLPVVGRNDEEGYFVKNAVGYALGNALPGLLRVDYMTRKGTGLGFDQAYQFGERAAGTAILYGIQGKTGRGGNTNGRVSHQQRIGDTLATLNTDFQNNSYNALSPNSRSQTTSLTATRTGTLGTTNATLSLSGNDDAGYVSLPASNSRNYQYALSQTARIGQSGNITFRFNGNDSSRRTSSFNNQGDTDPSNDVTTATASGTLQQTGDIRATGRLGSLFDFDMNANKVLASRRTGEGGGSGYFSGTQSLPELTLSTDSSRFGRTGLLASLPTRLSLGYGRFLNSTDTSSLSQRALFEAQTSARIIPLTPGGGLSLALNGNFRQTAYKSDFQRQVTDVETGQQRTETIKNVDYAQYVLRGDGGLTQRFGPTSAFNLTYNYLRPYGGAPQNFLSDRPGSANALGANLNLEGPRTRFTLRTGYDIQEAQREFEDLGNTTFQQKRNPWQQVTSSLALRASDALQARFEASYNINTGKLLTATNRTRIRGRNDFALDIGLQYDPQRRRFPQITETLSTPLFSRDLRLTILSGYNNITHQFYYKNIGLIQSFHDYEYVMTYRDQPYGFRSDRGFNFFIRLKAFPFVQRPASGRFGTALDTGTGEVF